ncbi:type II toxin-antitoxin system RelE family toxin [Romboutsia sp.]|uniref:type II toxin-antitoxin system RelE family toxin n=1 Tax=Romboutsia sp. TaxID=1965302 RepID=UPI003F32D7C1
MTNIYNIQLEKSVEKFIRKQNKDTQKRIIMAIYKLPEGDVKKLKGFKNYYRMRVGDIRVIFEKEDDKLKIIVIDIGNRGQIYNKY